MTVAFVAGASGQDGSYLAELLCSTGAEVHGLVRPATSDGARLRLEALGVILHEGDLRDEGTLQQALSSSHPDEVYNLAATTSVTASWQDPPLTADVTALGTARLLRQIWRLREVAGKDIRFLQASSAEVFGHQGGAVPRDESTPLNPDSPYGAAKAFAQSLVRMYRERGLHAVCAILYNHESPRRPRGFVTRKITGSVARISAGLQDYMELGDLESRRDWGWAPDYVDAMVLALRHPVPRDYVIATGRVHTVREFVETAFRCAGVEEWARHVRSEESLMRPGGPDVSVGDASLAMRELGWRPTVHFEQIVERMVEADLALLSEERRV